MTGGLVAVWALGLQAVAIGATRWPRLWLALFLSGAATLLGAGLLALGQGPLWEWRSELAIGGEPLHLRLDALSGLFLVLLAFISGAGPLHASVAWSQRAPAATARRGRTWWSMTVLCTSAVLLCSNGLHILIAWEGFAVSAYCLATLERERTAVRAAGWLFLAASRLGTLALIAFFTLLAVRTGSFDLGPMRACPDLAPLFWLALVGFGLKAGLFPLHVWVPSTYAEAPSHVSALLSGVVGLPPLNGFVSEWLIALGLLESAAAHADVALITAPALIALTVSGALVLATFVKAVSVTFLGASRDARTRSTVREGDWRERAPMLALALGCVLIASAPVAAWRLIVPALEEVNPLWTGLAPPAELVTLGRVQVALAAARVATTLVSAACVRSRGRRRALTLHCGLAAPTARMQLEATSFGSIATSWFNWLLGPERRYARPRGAFPQHAQFAERIKEPVLERALVGPVALVLGASAWARRRQHGRPQSYILYLVLGLLAVSAVILAEVAL